MKVFGFVFTVVLVIACGNNLMSIKGQQVEIHPGAQDSTSRAVLAQFLGNDFPDSTYAVCGKEGHFAVITEIDDEQRIVYFCEGNQSNTIRCVGRDTLLTPLGECSLSLREALQLKGNFLLLISPSHGSGYAAWFPEVYMLDDWSPRQVTREEFIQFSWPEESTIYYQCTTHFDSKNRNLYARNDTNFYADNQQLIRFSKGRKQLICVD